MSFATEQSMIEAAQEILDEVRHNFRTDEFLAPYFDNIERVVIVVSKRMTSAAGKAFFRIGDKNRMREDFVGKVALSWEDALREAKACAGTQFDPQVVEAFLACAERGEVDSSAFGSNRPTE